MAFTQKRTCKGCLFSHVSSCEYGVHIEVIPHAANKPLEPCHKITTNAEERRFHELGLDFVFKADLEIYRSNKTH